MNEAYSKIAKMRSKLNHEQRKLNKLLGRQAAAAKAGQDEVALSYSNKIQNYGTMGGDQNPRNVSDSRNPVYKRTLSLLSEISKGPNHPNPDPPPEGRKVPKLFGMKGKHLGSTDPQSSENQSQGRGRNDVPEVEAGYLNQAYKPPKPKTPNKLKGLLNAFVKIFGKRRDNGAK